MLIGRLAASSPDVLPTDVAHLIIPGRGRSPDGMSLNPVVEGRVDTAAAIYTELGLAEKGGVIVCAAYKTPGDQNGEPWSDGQELFQGKPEAYSMQDRLIEEHHIDPDGIRVAPHSFETVTDLVYGRNKLPDRRPVGVVAQHEQLERITSIILPVIFDRPWIGLVAPELDGMTDHDTRFARLASRLITTGLTPNSSDERVRRQANLVWTFALFAIKAQRTAQGLSGKLRPAADTLTKSPPEAEGLEPL